MKMPAGTINLLVHINNPLSVAAHIEAMSIAAEARTAAIIELGLTVGGRAATGTGTDCIAVSAPHGQTERRHHMRACIRTSVPPSVALFTTQCPKAAGSG